MHACMYVYVWGYMPPYQFEVFRTPDLISMLCTYACMEVSIHVACACAYVCVSYYLFEVFPLPTVSGFKIL